MARLNATTPKKPVNETFVTSDISPGEVSTKVYEACVQRLTNTPYEQQLDHVLKQIKRHPELDMVAFTMSDLSYADDMIHEVFQMNDDVVGFRGAFFMVALDRGTLQLGCRFGYPVIASPAILASEEDLRSMVQSTKFLLSYDLLKRNVSYLFYEMDIFFLQSPVPVLLQMEGDAICSAHQDNPFQPNIGCYAFRANKATLEFFKLCCDLLEEAPDTHDQHVFNNMWYLTVETLGGREYKFDGPAWAPKLPATPALTHPMQPESFDSLAFAANVHPIPHEKTIAIHPLCGAPLRTPHGKKMLAKELGGWYGFKSNVEEQNRAPQAGYYLRTGKHRRYLLLDGQVLGGHSTVMALGDRWANYHNSQMAIWTFAFLVLLARRTNRILILPKIVSDHGVVFLWRSLDLESIENLVDFRETGFPVNRKSWYNETVPFTSVARTALGVSWKPTTQWKLFAQLPGKEEIHAWKVDVDNPIDAWVGYMASPAIHDAELLLVNPQFIHAESFHPLTVDATTEARNPVVHEIREIAKHHLRWCDGVSQDAMNHWPAATYNPEADCYGRGESWQF
jgi:hypothetical protein